MSRTQTQSQRRRNLSPYPASTSIARALQSRARAGLKKIKIIPDHATARILDLETSSSAQTTPSTSPIPAFNISSNMYEDEETLNPQHDVNIQNNPINNVEDGEVGDDENEQLIQGEDGERVSDPDLATDQPTDETVVPNENVEQENNAVVLFDKNDPHQRQLLEEQLACEESWRQNVGTSTPHTNVSDTPNTSAFGENTVAIIQDGAFGGIQTPTTSSTTTTSTKTTKSASLPTTGTIPKKRVVTIAQQMLYRLGLLETSTFSLLEHVLGREGVDRDVAYTHLETLVEEWHKLRIRLQQVNEFDPEFQLLDLNITKIKTLQISITKLLKPPSRKSSQDRTGQDVKQVKQVKFHYKYGPNSKYDIPQGLVNELEEGGDHENWFKKDKRGRSPSFVFPAQGRGDTPTTSPTVPQPLGTHSSLRTTAVMSQSTPTVNSVLGNIPSPAQCAASSAASQGAAGGRGRHAWRQNPARNSPHSSSDDNRPPRRSNKKGGAGGGAGGGRRGGGGGRRDRNQSGGSRTPPGDPPHNSPPTTPSDSGDGYQSDSARHRRRSSGRVSNRNSNTRSHRSHSSYHAVRHHDYPRLPNINQKSWEWNGDFSILSNYLNRFWTHFRGLPELSSLSFLRGCIPDSFTHEIDAADTLEEALNSLSLWIEDSSIHSEKIYVALHNIPDA